MNMPNTNCCTPNAFFGAPNFFGHANPSMFLPNSPFGFFNQPSAFNPVSPFGWNPSFQNNYGGPTSPFGFNALPTTFNPYSTLNNTVGFSNPMFTQPFNPMNTINPFSGFNTPSFGQPVTPWNATPWNTTPWNTTPWSATPWNNPFATTAPWSNTISNFGGFGPNQFGGFPTPINAWNTYGYAGIPTPQPTNGQPISPASLIAQTLGSPINAQPVNGVRIGSNVNGVVAGQPTQNTFVNPVNGQPMIANPALTYLPGFNPLATITPWFGFQPAFGPQFNPMQGFGQMTPWGVVPFGHPMANFAPVQPGAFGQTPTGNPTLCREAA